MKEVPRSGTKFPRGAERRHFRGDFAVRAVDKLCAQFPDPQDFFTFLSKPPTTAKSVAKRVKTLYGFGEWISWKVPDISERLGLIPVEFTDECVYLMFDSSLKGAQEVARVHVPNSKDPLMDAHKFLINKLGHLKAPPIYDRSINVQETETVFCKWKSHLGGHYPPGKDTVEILHGLERFKQCPSSQALIRELKKLEVKVRAMLS